MVTLTTATPALAALASQIFIFEWKDFRFAILAYQGNFFITLQFESARKPPSMTHPNVHGIERKVTSYT